MLLSLLTTDHWGNAMGRPQLEMRHENLDDLPQVELPEGYTLRRFEPGDEAAWISVLNSTGDLSEWTLDNVQRVFRPDGHVVKECISLVMHGDTPVGCAGIALYDPVGSRPPAEVSWVAVRPEHRGKRLGYWVSLAAMRLMRERGHRRCFLTTDDVRLPAIEIYLRLGFQPYMWHETHPERWREV